MTREQREDYINQVKKTFQSYESNRRSDEETKTEEAKGWWKVRTVLALIVFVLLFGICNSEAGEKMQVYEKVEAAIKKNVNIDTITALMEQTGENRN